MLLISRFKIQGHSMEPTLENGKSVLASNIPYLFSKPKVGDIIVTKIGRKSRHSGKRGTSASRISSQSLKPTGRFWASQNDETNNKYLVKRIARIDKERYFVKGDNERDSKDSRMFGWVGEKEIVGKVIYKFRM